MGSATEKSPAAEKILRLPMRRSRKRGIATDVADYVSQVGSNCKSLTDSLILKAEGTRHCQTLVLAISDAKTVFSAQKHSVHPFAARVGLSSNSAESSSDHCLESEERLSLAFLDEFKSKKSRSLEISDIVGHVVKVSMDRYGSHFIQRKIEIATVEEKKKIFSEIISVHDRLTRDDFGNCVVQKFLEEGTENQKEELAKLLTTDVVDLSLHGHGFKVILKALEKLDLDQRSRIAQGLDGSVIERVVDPIGCLVIQKCIECVPHGRIQFIFTTFYKGVFSLSTHPHAWRAIQSALKCCDDLSVRVMIMDELMPFVGDVSRDPFGNFVIQSALEHGRPQDRSSIINKFAKQIVEMSMHQFASDVIKKCLTFCSRQERQLLIDEIFDPSNHSQSLQVMMVNRFGISVLQTVINTCDIQKLEFILAQIGILLHYLRRDTCRIHTIARIEKLVEAGEKRLEKASSDLSQAIIPD